MNGRPWTDWEVKYLKKHYGKKLHRDMARILGRTIPSIRRKATKLGLTSGEFGRTRIKQHNSYIKDEKNNLNAPEANWRALQYAIHKKCSVLTALRTQGISPHLSMSVEGGVNNVE